MIHDTRVIPINGGPHLWDAAPHLRHSTQPDVFEYGCHEGNYAMRNILSGARAAEKAAATGSNGH